MLIDIQNIAKTYKMEKIEVSALRGVTFQIDRGEFVSIMGSSGSGKTTLMDILGCLMRPTKGKYFLEGQDVSQLKEDQLAEIRNKKIGFVFQGFNLLARTSALHNVELPLIYNDTPKKERRERAYQALQSVGLEHRIHHRSNELSGGQQQRVAIARALVNNPSIIFADEPTGNLDSQSGEEIMEIFDKLHRQGSTIIMVTHEMDIAKHAQRVIHLKDGQIMEDEGGSCYESC
ncbi:ABC transporter ATP-binding protein [bacterium]|nr:ABC transporter ATP-binding protein [bacterium]MBU1753723.1 ABC transporter ATP-binding protein [bacterium]